ncbi:MAG: GTP-binding protein [Isosphaeraceae bacterium]
MRTSRYALPLVLTTIAAIALILLLSTVGDMHDRLARYSPRGAVVFLVGAAVVMLVAGGAAARLFWKLGRDTTAAAQAPSDVVQAAEIQAEKAGTVISQVRDESVRADLAAELAALRADREHRRFHVVVFGTGSAGKTSLINALLGRHVGKTDPIMGTTRQGEIHTQEIEGVEGTLWLTDTPGLSEIGGGGLEREREARDLAARSDLLLFVVDHDLTRSEFDPLIALARQGKRSIVVFNKKDRFPDADRDAILDKLRERLRGIVVPDDVVAVAASPRPTPVRVTAADGTVSTVLEAEPPDIEPLRDRIAATLSKEGDTLRAGNLLLRAHLVGKRAQDQLGKERDERAKGVVDKFQWITAATVFTNPVPALDLLATGAVQFQMISELAAVYGVEITSAHAKMIGTQMVQYLLKLGMVEASTSLIAGLFKSSLVGYAAGGAVQCVTMAYLTHISGLTFREYFARGQNWGDGGMQAALVRQFDLNSRSEFLQEFARQAVDKVISKALGSRDRGKNRQPSGASDV